MPTGIGTGLLLSSIIGGGASIAGGALANRGKQTQSTTPTMDPAYGPLQSMVLDSVTKRLQKPLDMSGYTANGLADTNAAFAGAKRNLANTLAARGLSGSPVAGAGAATLETGRAGANARFMNSVPLVENDLADRNISLANSVLAGGRGTTSTGTAESGGGAAGAFTNLAQYLGYLTGKGAFGGGGKSPLASRSTVPNMGFLPGGDY